MATHSSILAWEIPWTEEPGRLQSMELQKGQTQPKDNKPLTQSQTFNSHLTQSLEYLKSALGMCGSLRLQAD